MVLVLALIVAGCAPKVSVDQLVAQCKLQAVQANHTTDPDDANNDAYIKTCMQARGYEIKSDCAVYAPAIMARCYGPAQ